MVRFVTRADRTMAKDKFIIRKLRSRTISAERERPISKPQAKIRNQPENDEDNRERIGNPSASSTQTVVKPQKQLKYLGILFCQSLCQNFVKYCKQIFLVSKNMKCKLI